MRLMVRGEHNGTGVVAAQTRVDFPRKMKFFLQPLWHAAQERTKPARRERQRCLQDALKFQQWLFIEHHRVKLAGVNAGFA